MWYNLSMPKSGLAVGIDAGSHALKGLVLSVSKNAPKEPLPRILKKKFIKLPISYDPQLPADYGVKLSSKLKEFVLDMVKESPEKPVRAVICLGPNLASLSIQKYVVQAKNKEKILTAAASEKYLTNLKNQFVEKDSGGEVILLETLANNYAVDYKEVKVPESFELSFRVIVPKLTPEASAMAKEIKGLLGGLDLEFFPNSYLHQLALTKAYGTHTAFVIDVGGENTQLTLLKDGSMAHTHSFPLGARHFIRGMAKIAELTYEEAENLKKQYVQGLVNEARKKQIHSFLIEESKLWYKMFAESIDNFYHLGPLPTQIFMFGGGANLPEIGNLVRGGEWMRNASFVDYPKVNILGGESLFEGNTFDGYLHGPEDFNLASSVFYLSR